MAMYDINVLIPYARHVEGCGFSPRVPCSCGLEEALYGFYDAVDENEAFANAASVMASALLDALVEQAPNLTCDEVEAINMLLRRLGRDEDVADVVWAHAASDMPDDLHYLGPNYRASDP